MTVQTQAQERPKTLPPEFQDLSEWEDWIQWVEEERIQKRVDSSIEEIRQFYDAVFPRLKDILDYFATTDPQSMNDEPMALFCLATSFMEIADAVEYYAPDSTAPSAMPGFRPSHGFWGMPDETRRQRFIT